jgi:DNA-binding CsgD family transcriptional regulator
VELLLSRALIGRDGELSRIERLVDDAAVGTGGGLMMVGEAGVGKSRLCRELEDRARTRGLYVLPGRSVEDAAEPFRPLSDALLSGFRETGYPRDRAVLPLRATLAHLVPEWSSAATGDASALAIAEALLRLLQVAADDRAALLVIEDAHWADPDTLTILEHLVDHADAHGAQIVVTLRSEPPTPALQMARRLADRRVAGMLELRPLAPPDVDRMVLSCLGQDAVAGELRTFVHDHSDGIPFFVEELLAGLVREEALVRDVTGWRWVPQHRTPSVPVTLAASVERRVRDLGATALQVLFAAAVLGRRFDWRLLPAATGLSEDVITSALRETIHEQLVVTDGEEFRFRHALTRDHVIALMLPAERRQVAQRTLDTVQRAHPDLTAGRPDIAAELAELAGRPDQAARHLVTAATRAADRGALSSAAVRLERARGLVTDPDAVARIDEHLARVYALGGQAQRASALADAALRSRRSRGDASASEIDLQLALARAAMSSGDLQRAARRVNAARHRACALADRTRVARATSLAAQVAAEDGDLDSAADLARQALQDAAELPDVWCEAHETVGRCLRVIDVAGAEAAFAEALACAERHGLAVWQARALHELGTIDLLDTMRTARLDAARRAAIGAGAPATAAVVDFHLASAFVAQGRTEKAREAAQRSIAVAERLGLSILAPALTVLARSYAHEGDIEPMEAAIGRAEAAAPGDASVEAAVWGNVRTMLHLHQADRRAALAALDRATCLLRKRLPGEHFPHWGLWALLRTLGDEERQARTVAAAAAGCDTRLNIAHVLAAEAIVSGREGHAGEAAQRFHDAIASIEVYEGSDWLVHTTWWLVAPAALADGWGEPITWLQSCVRWFDAHGHAPLATDCRAMLRDAGGPVPRRGRGASAVPDELRRLGVTSREMDVLTLASDERSNGEIAEQLVISPRTVEKHMASLLRKTGAADRGELPRVTGRQGH